MANVKQKIERYNIVLAENETIEIRLNGNVVYSATVGTGKTANVQFSFDEEEVTA